MNENVLAKERPADLAASMAFAQASNEDTGLWALAAVATQFHVHVDRIALAHELALSGRRCVNGDLLRAAALIGLKARVLAGESKDRLATVPRPAILRMRDGQYVVLGRGHSGGNELFRLGSAQPEACGTDKIAAHWSGEIVLVGQDADQEPEPTPEFGLRWFIPSIWRYRHALSQVLISSLFLQLLALIAPVFIQVIIDKVLVHNSISTLTIVTLGLIVIGLFDVTLQYLRSYALTHTASRLDVELGRRVFSHLLRLPLSYFESHPTGQILERIREVDTVRNFFTGQGLMSLLDVMFGILFFGVLFLYSPRLTLIVVISIPVYVAIIAVVRPILRHRMMRRFNRSAASQQFLVESVVGAQTLKAAAVEPIVQSQWEEKRASFAQSAFHSTIVGYLGLGAIDYVSKLVTALILFFGAKAVMAGTLTIGELIAFNMIAGQVVAPIIRLSHLWQEFQQVQVSVTRLGDIMRSPTELQPNALANLPPIRGEICLQNIGFRYAPDGPDVLKDLSLDIPAGRVIGIVGPSGSGKSTLTKLIQRLHSPQRGRILVDGIDIARVHPAWLRQQIGVVLQDNLLFNRTIHQNIALSTPYSSREQVVAVAKLAGADEFIAQMPRGYDTVVEERGANLSGGQRQRIALARALAHNPRILILDEATSAVDYESERIIHRNLGQIARGRTVIIIAHRLLTVRNCDCIVGLEAGSIVEEGTHEELLRIEGGLYRRLWSLQIDPGQ